MKGGTGSVLRGDGEEGDAPTLDVDGLDPDARRVGEGGAEDAEPELGRELGRFGEAAREVVEQVIVGERDGGDAVPGERSDALGDGDEALVACGFKIELAVDGGLEVGEREVGGDLGIELEKWIVALRLDLAVALLEVAAEHDVTHERQLDARSARGGIGGRNGAGIARWSCGGIVSLRDRRRIDRARCRHRLAVLARRARDGCEGHEYEQQSPAHHDER